LGKEEVEKYLEVRDGIFALQVLAYRDEWELTGTDVEYAIRRIARMARHLEKGELRALVEWYKVRVRVPHHPPRRGSVAPLMLAHHLDVAYREKNSG